MFRKVQYYFWHPRIHWTGISLILSINLNHVFRSWRHWSSSLLRDLRNINELFYRGVSFGISWKLEWLVSYKHYKYGKQSYPPLRLAVFLSFHILFSKHLVHHLYLNMEHISNVKVGTFEWRIHSPHPKCSSPKYNFGEVYPRNWNFLSTNLHIR